MVLIVILLCFLAFPHTCPFLLHSSSFPPLSIEYITFVLFFFSFLCFSFLLSCTLLSFFFLFPFFSCFHVLYLFLLSGFLSFILFVHGTSINFFFFFFNHFISSCISFVFFSFCLSFVFVSSISCLNFCTFSVFFLSQLSLICIFLFFF